MPYWRHRPKGMSAYSRGYTGATLVTGGYRPFCPACDFIQDVGIGLLLGDRSLLGDFERVVSIFDCIQFMRSREPRKDPLQLFRCPECIARPLHEEHRDGYLRQVFVAHLIGLAGRMQRVSEKDEARQALDSRGCDLRSY